MFDSADVDKQKDTKPGSCSLKGTGDGRCRKRRERERGGGGGVVDIRYSALTASSKLTDSGEREERGELTAHRADSRDWVQSPDPR